MSQPSSATSHSPEDDIGFVLFNSENSASDPLFSIGINALGFMEGTLDQVPYHHKHEYECSTASTSTFTTPTFDLPHISTTHTLSSVSAKLAFPSYSLTKSKSKSTLFSITETPEPSPDVSTDAADTPNSTISTPSSTLNDRTNDQDVNIESALTSDFRRSLTASTFDEGSPRLPSGYWENLQAMEQLIEEHSRQESGPPRILVTAPDEEVGVDVSLVSEAELQHQAQHPHEYDEDEELPYLYTGETYYEHAYDGSVSLSESEAHSVVDTLSVRLQIPDVDSRGRVTTASKPASHRSKPKLRITPPLSIFRAFFHRIKRWCRSTKSRLRFRPITHTNPSTSTLRLASPPRKS
ncbi:hypothetical protein JAAARDRAFT_203940 [Jaapia argillacea MUCL 33604]|uniref:Uncharacterized protein n=1 Tax=Jaapia argillacea MUCL 33604 TaxID=933084 RepID=A0A067Q306_9AGAM|nr:hypothetical protein JAAARDRAFT_203940 [Jaapia argillacea MUCL 33604]